MAFIGQINLSDATLYDVEGALTSSGLLSFFYATDGEPSDASDDPTTWHVTHYDGDLSALRRYSMPANLDDLVRFTPSSVTFVPISTLPGVGTPEVADLGLTREERNRYSDVENKLDLIRSGEILPAPDHRLLGYAYPLEISPVLLAYLKSRGLDSTTWSLARPEQRRVIERAADDEWQLLLQVGTDPETGMDWAGGGYIYYCIPRAALRDRDFSSVWLEMEFL